MSCPMMPNFFANKRPELLHEKALFRDKCRFYVQAEYLPPAAILVENERNTSPLT
jgi:hypothetical protein